MLEREAFEAIFGTREAPYYETATVEKIREFRTKLGGRLLVDKLLQAIGMHDASTRYPPRSDENFREIHRQIISSSSPYHHKDSVLLYLLKDVSHRNSHAPQQFAKAAHLPQKYETFIDGLWFMDRMKFEKALDYLTEPALTPTFPEDILYILSRYTRPHETSLPIAYYTCVSPPLTSQKVSKAYFSVLCRASTTEAFYFSRTQEAAMRSELFQELLTTTLQQRPGEAKATQSYDLTYFPLDEQEQKWFHDYSTSNKKFAGCSDISTLRDIILEKSPSISNDETHPTSRAISGVDWKWVSNAVM